MWERQRLETQIWQGEIARDSRDFVRWVQQALNKVLGLRLAVDGVIGPITRDAIRTFQRWQGLVVDGIVDPETERALVRAGATPRSGSPPAPVGGSAGGYQPTTTASGLRQNAIRIALAEWERWGRGTIRESNPRIRPVLEDYWRSGAGWLPSDSNWWVRYPWSAAFISWVMRRAGAGNAFSYSSSHAHYIAAARDNRRANNQNPFKAYRVSEVSPQPGDLVCKRRQSGVTYDNVRRGHKTHCDIVTAIQVGQLIAIGGNVSDSVKDTKVSIDNQGRISESSYFAVIRYDPPR